MSSQEDTSGETLSSPPVRIAGFLVGLFGTLVLGLVGGFIYTGVGFGDVKSPPPQVYTNF